MEYFGLGFFLNNTVYNKMYHKCVRLKVNRIIDWRNVWSNRYWPLAFLS